MFESISSKHSTVLYLKKGAILLEVVDYQLNYRSPTPNLCSNRRLANDMAKAKIQ